MSCSHTDQTLLWLYGELDDDTVVNHISSCEACGQLVADHEAVQAAVAPVAMDLTLARPQPANRPMWWVAALTVAAVGLTMVGTSVLAPTPFQPDDTDLVAMVEPDTVDVYAPLFGELDAGIEAIDLELAELSNDFGSL